MEHKTVSSSNIVSVGYDEATSTLEVTFTTGKTYAYEGVEPATRNAFIAAGSPGRFFAEEIRGQYPTRAV